MTKLCWYMLCAVVLFTSCRRNSDDGVIPEPPAKIPFTFYIDGAHDTTVEQSGNASVLLMVKYMAGEREIVTLSAEGLPQGVTASFYADNAKNPPFNTFVILHANKAAVGTYPVKIIGSSFAGRDTATGFNLQVKPYANPATGLAGEYRENGNCTTSGAVTNNLCTISVLGMNHINIQGLLTQKYNVTADIDPVSNTLTIPPQNLSGITLEGTGTYTTTQINISYKLTGTTVNETCATTLTAQ